jgi:hypothetical protein
MQEGDEIKIKIRSKIKRGTQKCERHPSGGGETDSKQQIPACHWPLPALKFERPGKYLCDEKV